MMLMSQTSLSYSQVIFAITQVMTSLPVGREPPHFGPSPLGALLFTEAPKSSAHSQVYPLITTNPSPLRARASNHLIRVNISPHSYESSQ